MNNDLDPILDRFAAELQAWLDAPSETSAQLVAMKRQIEALKDEIGAEPLNAAVKALEDGDRHILVQRQSLAAEAIAARLKPLGMRLRPDHAPSKRRLRKSPGTGRASTTRTKTNSSAGEPTDHHSAEADAVDATA